MAAKVFIDGAIFEPETAAVPVLDRGFLYGDSVYEVMRTSGGNPVDLDAHLDRLERSAATIVLALPGRARIVDAVRATLTAAANPESYIRVMVTRGSGEIGLDPALAGGPRLIVIVRPLQLPPEEAYTRGIKLHIVDAEGGARRGLDPTIKTGNYLTNIMALHQARQAGADEAVLCDAEGRVAEGSNCNLFVVQGQRVITPARAIGLLAGITRQRVIELACAHGVEVAEGVLTPDAVRQADEVFITSSVRGVVPVAEVDGQPLRGSVVGPITQKIMSLYGDYLAAQARP